MEVRNGGLSHRDLLPDGISTGQTMSESAFMWIAAFWMAAVGGSVGSFLNVVIYRLPAGMSLSYPGSHCPKCGHPIRWHDNVPVFGWLMLRGRCRDCRSWIPIRYPVVEGAVAGLFLLIAVAEGTSLGANLPVRPVSVVDGLIFPPLGVGGLAGIMGWHLLMLCTLFCASLIRYDGHDVPLRLFGPALVVGILGSILWPWLHPQPAAVLATGPTPGIVDGLAGFTAGAVMGLVAWKALEPGSRPEMVWAAGMVGTILGWQAAVVIGGGTLVLGFVSRIVGGVWAPCRRMSAVAWLGIIAAVWIVQWQHLVAWLPGLLGGE